MKKPYVTTARPLAYAVTRPDGYTWPRRFTSADAAWGFIVRGANTRREWLERQLRMVREAWWVERVPPASPDQLG